MTQTRTENEPATPEVDPDQLVVDDGEKESEQISLETQVECAALEIDARTAESNCRSLLAHLADDPQSVPELEALIILGLAHPSVFEAHRIPLAQEGRRLAHLLELEGKPQRAQALLEMIIARTPGDRQIDHELASMMRRSGNADRLIERYMRRAEESVAGGRTKEAISWLQEILLVDSSRRDIARMIRDLRWGDQEKRIKWRRQVRLSATILVLGILITLVVRRELDVGARYDAVPAAISGDLPSLHARLDQLDRLGQDVDFSLRMYDASRDRARLKVEITQLESQALQLKNAHRGEREAQLAIAESARKQGRILAQQNRFPEALEQFERALADGPAEWDQRPQIQTDVAAIREWITMHGSDPVGKSR